jgi:hypothetical protein
MLGVLKRLWATIKPRRARSGSRAWRHGHGGRYSGFRQPSETQHVPGPRNGWGATRGPGF